MIRLILIAFSMLCCLGILVRHSNAEIDPTTAVGVWLFNETGGDTASDSSENGNDGTLMGDPEWVPGGKFGNALELDGAGDYVSVPDDKTLDTEISETFSIVIWVQGTYRPNDWHGLVTKAQGWRVDMCYLLQRAANGKFEFALFGEGGNDSWTASDILPEDDTWYHVGAVYTGDEAQVYVDGVLSATRETFTSVFHRVFDTLTNNYPLLDRTKRTLVHLVQPVAVQSGGDHRVRVLA